MLEWASLEGAAESRVHFYSSVLRGVLHAVPEQFFAYYFVLLSVVLVQRGVLLM